MSDVRDAIEQACAEVGIQPPRDTRDHVWVRTDTFSGRNGRGDGSVKVADRVVFAMNFQTGEKSTVWFGEENVRVDRARLAQQRAEAHEAKRLKAERAVDRAQRLIAAGRLSTHPYLARKGFANEKALVVVASAVSEISGPSMVPDGAERAIIVPARIGERVTSAQLIWEDGTKRFLYGGEMGGAVHRLAAGRDTWLCEGFATALSLRTALRAMSRQDAVLICFSASNIATVARRIDGRCWIAADHDRPLDQLDGVGTGEHYAKLTGRPYAMPPDEGQDINDMHVRDGIFAVQRMLSETIRRGLQ